MTPPDAEPTTETPKDTMLRWWFERGITVGKADAHAQVETLEASLKKEGGCDVCWTASWEPVENGENCVLAEHPHPEEPCFRCGQCALIAAYKKLEAKNAVHELREAELQGDLEALEAESRAFAADVRSLSKSLGKKIERVTELEAENERMLLDAALDERFR